MSRAIWNKKTSRLNFFLFWNLSFKVAGQQYHLLEEDTWKCDTGSCLYRSEEVFLSFKTFLWAVQAEVPELCLCDVKIDNTFKPFRYSDCHVNWCHNLLSHIKGSNFSRKSKVIMSSTHWVVWSQYPFGNLSMLILLTDRKYTRIFPACTCLHIIITGWRITARGHFGESFYRCWTIYNNVDQLWTFL